MSASHIWMIVLSALSSLVHQLKGHAGEKAVDLFFGPSAPTGTEGQWIKTLPGKGWFVYFRTR